MPRKRDLLTLWDVTANELLVLLQRAGALKEARQKGDDTLRRFVTGWVPTFGGGGKPQRIWISSRSPSAVRATGAIWSGKIAGRGGTLPALSRMIAKARRMAPPGWCSSSKDCTQAGSSGGAWPLVESR